MFLKRKTSRPTRERLLGDDDSDDKKPSDENASPDPNDSPAAALAARLKAKKREKEKKSRLSFGGDELDAAASPTAKKSLRASLILKDGVVLNADSADVSNLSIDDDITATPKYSRAYLDELKRDNTRPPRPTSDAEIILDPFDDPNSLGDINEPSVQEIARLKAKRQQLRSVPGATTASAVEEDFINLPLTVRANNLAKDDGPHPESRLVREEDEVGDAEDELAEFTGATDRISLSSSGRMKARGRDRADAMDLVVDLEDDLSDPETREWEAKQVNRGSGSVSAFSRMEKRAYTPLPIPPIQPLPTLAQSLQALSIRLSSITNTHLSHTSSLSKLSEEMDELEKKEEELRRLIQGKEKERVEMGAIHESVETIGSFLGVKFPPLIDVEKRHIQLLRERCKLLIQRVLEHPSSNTSPSLSEEDSIALDHELSKLQDRKERLMEDVEAVDFQDPRIGVGGVFTKWREQYPETYEAAFGSLGIIGAWEWWVRWDMCGWDMIREPRSLDSFKWFIDLHAYSNESSSGGTEEDLAAAMVRTAVLPRAIAFLVPGKLENEQQTNSEEEFATWSPFNQAEVKRVVDLVEEIEAYVSSSTSPSGGDLAILMRGVRRAFRTAISAIGGFSPVVNQASDDHRRVGKVLLENLKAWRRVDDKSEGECTILIRALERMQ